MVELAQINLGADEGPIGHQTFDVIFCRNVVIYFDRPTQTKLFDRFYEVLGHRNGPHSRPAPPVGDAKGFMQVHVAHVCPNVAGTG